MTSHQTQFAVFPFLFLGIYHHVQIFGIMPKSDFMMRFFFHKQLTGEIPFCPELEFAITYNHR